MPKRIYALSGIFVLVTVLMPLSIFAVEQQDKDAIWTELNSFIDKDPDILRDIIFSMGDSYSRENKLDEAIALYEKALRILPDNEDFLNRLGSLHNQKGDYAKAAETYKRLTELRPDNMWYLNMLSGAYRNAGDKGKAGALWEGLMQESNDANFFMQAANFYSGENNMEKAIEAVERAVELEPANIAYLQNLESFYIRAERLGDAEEVCNRIAGLSEDVWIRDWVDSELINIYQRQDRLGELIERFENELTAAPDDVRQYKRIAVLYQRSNERDKAIEVLERTVAVSAEDMDINNRLLDLYEWSERFDSAEAQIKKIIAASPQDVYLYERLANLLSRAGKQKEAREAWRQFLENVPNDADALSRFGDALNGWGDVKGAIEQYRKAQSLDPNNFWYTMRVVDILISKERFGEAKQNLDDIIAHTSDDRIRQEAERKGNEIAGKLEVAAPGPKAFPEERPKKKKRRGWWY